jgi:hypothetical protein
MGKRRFTLLTVLALLFTAFLKAGAQCCDDCNGNGVVTIDEVLTGVNNALNGCSTVSTSPTPGPSPTPLPDQCTTDLPGDRFTVLGTDYVVVEVEVRLENSQDTYLLRYPAELDADGHLARSVSNIYLKQAPCNAGYTCEPLGSICGFTTRFRNGTAESSYGDSNGTPTWTFSFSTYSAVSIFVDEVHESAYLSFAPKGVKISINVPALSGSGYSLADANYPEVPAAQIAQLKAELASLFTHISLTRAPLPIPPTFPPTPTPRPCLEPGTECDLSCPSPCCAPSICTHNSGSPDPFWQCVYQAPTPTPNPLWTPTPQCPR